MALDWIESLCLWLHEEIIVSFVGFRLGIRAVVRFGVDIVRSRSLFSVGCSGG